jgi:hypothetical protein
MERAVVDRAIKAACECYDMSWTPESTSYYRLPNGGEFEGVSHPYSNGKEIRIGNLTLKSRLEIVDPAHLLNSSTVSVQPFLGDRKLRALYLADEDDGFAPYVKHLELALHKEDFNEKLIRKSFKEHGCSTVVEALLATEILFLEISKIPAERGFIISKENVTVPFYEPNFMLADIVNSREVPIISDGFSEHIRLKDNEAVQAVLKTK